MLFKTKFVVFLRQLTKEILLLWQNNVASNINVKPKIVTVILEIKLTSKLYISCKLYKYDVFLKIFFIAITEKTQFQFQIN